MGAAFNLPRVARGAAYGDVNNDGTLDILDLHQQRPGGALPERGRNKSQPAHQARRHKIQSGRHRRRRRRAGRRHDADRRCLAAVRAIFPRANSCSHSASAPTKRPMRWRSTGPAAKRDHIEKCGSRPDHHRKGRRRNRCKETATKKRDLVARTERDISPRRNPGAGARARAPCSRLPGILFR